MNSRRIARVPLGAPALGGVRPCLLDAAAARGQKSACGRHGGAGPHPTNPQATLTSPRDSLAPGGEVIS